MKNLICLLLLFLGGPSMAQWRTDKNTAVAVGTDTRFEVWYDGALEYSTDGQNWKLPNLAEGGYGITIKNVGGAQVFYARQTSVGSLMHPKPIAPPPVVVVAPDVKLTVAPPSSVSIGLVGEFYGSNSVALAKELDGGFSTFNFYGNSVSFPALRKAADPLILQTDDLVAIRLPTHSVVNRWGSAPVRSGVAMKLFDSGGALVWELYDTKSGYHPNAFGYGGYSKRGNNHPDDGCRWIKKGVYKLWYKNISDNTVTVQEAWFGTARVGTARKIASVKPGEEIWWDLDMSILGDRSDSFKLNCNFY